MKITELKAAERRHSNWALAACLPALIFMLGADLMSPWVHRQFETLNMQIEEASIGTAIVIIGVVFAVAGLLIAQRCLPRCPSCSERWGSRTIEIVIATKNCTSCGRAVIENEYEP